MEFRRRGSGMDHQNDLLWKDLAHFFFFMTDVIGDTCSSFLPNMSLDSSARQHCGLDGPLV